MLQRPYTFIIFYSASKIDAAEWIALNALIQRHCFCRSAFRLLIIGLFRKMR